MYFYSGLLLNKYFLPVRQYLFYAGDGNQSINNSLQMFDAVSFQYFLFDFRRIAYQDLLTHPAVAVFAVLANFGNQSNEKAIETIVGAIKQKTPDPLALSRYAVQLQILSE
ncbi:MAG: hypothetical protein MUD08_15580, partial [Cytophagales bacterium]|nr:hypothetical protein [Cytophagales bacterium]